MDWILNSSKASMDCLLLFGSEAASLAKLTDCGRLMTKRETTSRVTDELPRTAVQAATHAAGEPAAAAASMLLQHIKVAAL